MNSSTNYLNKIFAFLAAIVFFPFCFCAAEAALSTDDHLTEPMRVAVLPLENLSGKAGPLKEVRATLIDAINRRGMKTIDEQTLQTFMASHRVRYTGGIDSQTSRALLAETGAGAVLITSLEFYSAQEWPKIAVISRLVSSGDNPEILWMDSVGMSGDESPGLLSLGLIYDADVLMNRAVGKLADSLAEYLSGEKRGWSAKRTFRPRDYYNALDLKGVKWNVAVVPFFNVSGVRNAGDIVMLQFVKGLVRSGITVVEPGLVREQMLKTRVVMDGGLSLKDADMLANVFEADLVMNGKVQEYTDYLGPVGAPKVDFSVLGIDKKGRKVVWASRSHNLGDERVLFFDWGKVYTAGELASEMVRAVIEKMM